MLKRWIGLVLLAGMSHTAFAGDHFLTIGGGNSPNNNQVSLERNIVYYQRVLSECGHESDPHDIYFACGNDNQRDLQFIDLKAVPPKANLLLAQLYGRENDLYQSYRPHDLKNLKGSATRQSINVWFEKTGARLTDGDRLFIYFTGHGSGGKPERNTTMDLWQDGGMPVKEFSGLLDKLNQNVKVVLIMVQCHSGGFADVIFKDSTAGPQLSAGNRCGFFATWHNRLAAGCTPDTAEENYREYSTYFLAAALSGKSRGGKGIKTPDHDGDGKTSMAEAHAYVQINSETIDIPVCTSDILLRQFSKTKDDKIKDLITASTPFDKLLELATPDRKAVLEELAKMLDLKGDDRAAAARTFAAAIEKQRRELDQQKQKLNTEREQLKRQLRGKVQVSWPEMTNPWHPAVSQAIVRDGDKIVSTIESHPAYKRFAAIGAEVEAVQTKNFDLERKWVKCQRFLYVAETVALAANLDKTATKLIQEKYKAMRAAECGLFGQAKTVALDDVKPPR